MTIAFMPGDATYNGVQDTQVLGEEYVRTLRRGDLLANEECNPLVHGR